MHRTKATLRFYVILINLYIRVHCADISHLDIHGNDYYTSGIAIFNGRAFLAIPRSVCANQLTYPTLIEVLWTGDNKVPFTRKKVFPSNREQTWHQCSQLQDVISVDVENAKGRLWVLDKGNEKCEPKVTVYNLIYFNSIVHSVKLKNTVSTDLTTLVIDPYASGLNQRDSIAFVGDPGDNSLLMISLRYAKPTVVKLTAMSLHKPVGVGTKYLTVSKVEPLLYMATDKKQEVYSVDLKYLRAFKPPNNINAKELPVMHVNATFNGNKLGQSSALIADLKRGLSYFLIRDYAVLRWNTSAPMTAENHNLLVQSYKALPYVSCFFIGPYNGLWALVNPAEPEWCTDRNRTGKHLIGEEVDFKSRTVKLLKYNDVMKY